MGSEISNQHPELLHLAWRGEPPGFSRVAAGALDLQRGPLGPSLVASRPCLSIYAFFKAYSKECEYLGGAPLLKSFRVRTRTTQPTLSHSWIVKRSVSTF